MGRKCSSRLLSFLLFLDHKEQKKTYKMLEEICKCDTEEAKQFFASSLPGRSSPFTRTLHGG